MLLKNNRRPAAGFILPGAYPAHMGDIGAHAATTHDELTSDAPISTLASGIVAPPFTLFATPDQHVSLSICAEVRVILAFYRADWSPF